MDRRKLELILEAKRRGLITPEEAKTRAEAVVNVGKTIDTMPENIGLQQAKSFGYGVGKGATMGFADEIAGGFGKLQGEDYTQARDKYRANEAEAFNKAPIAGYIGEFAGGAPAAILAPGVGGAIAQGAAYGAGAADELKDVPISALAGGSAGGLLHGTMSALKKPFMQPDRIRARAMGASAKDFSKIGASNAEEIARGLSDTGIYSKNATIPSVDIDNFGNVSLKYTNPSKGLLKEKMTEPVIKIGRNGVVDVEYKPNRKLYNPDISAEDNISLKLERGIELLSDKADEILTEATKKDKHIYFADDLLEKDRNGMYRLSGLNDLVKKYSQKAEGNVYKTAKKARGLIDDSLSQVDNPHFTGGDPVKMGYDLKGLNEVKRSLQNKARDMYGKGETKNQTMEEFNMDLAKVIKEFIESKSPASLKNVNAETSKLLSQKEIIDRKIAQKAVEGTKAPIGVGEKNTIIKGTEQAASTPFASALRAGVGDRMMSVPLDKRAMMQRGISLIPGEFMDRTGDNSRQPQSIPQQLSLVRFPRNTEFFKNNKEAVTLKIAQSKPELLDHVEALYLQPEKLHNILPLLSAQMPELFDDDPYNRFDGEVQDPQMRIKARKDIMKDDSLNNTQKFNMINKMNKTGELNDY